MIAVLYTNTNSIRAAIGVSDIEVSDTQITDLNVEDQLILYLNEVYPQYEALSDANEVGQNPTPEQAKDWLKLKLLCQYAAAVILLQAGQYLLAQSITEGGTIMSRFSKEDIVTTLERLEAKRDEFLGSLIGSGAVYTYNPFVKGEPDYDPVVGEQ